jgi:spore germination protein PB
MINVYQTINIQSLRINGISNSSVLQIGTAGIIKSLSNLYNTGRFSGPAPEAGPIEPSPLVPFGGRVE